MEFVILGAIAFAFCLYTFLVWRERRAERLRLAPPTGAMSAYRGALPQATKLSASTPFVVNAAALGTFAFAFLVPAEFLLDRLAAWMARGMAKKGAEPLAFVPSWRVGAWLLRRDARAENAVERTHRLQVLVNLFLMVGLAFSATVSSHPALFVSLATLLFLRAMHTRLLGKVAKAFEPAAHALAGFTALGPADEKDEKKEEDVPPWLSRALTRRAENRLGATPLGSARPLPPERAEVRIATEAAEGAPTTSDSASAAMTEHDEAHAEELQADEAEPPKARRTIG